MIKVFYSPHFERDIEICISKNDVDFIFSTQSDDFAFYDFLKSEWHTKYKAHMKSKKWFTQEMADFITQNIQPC